ncbi:MAG: hypothetical protein NVSMB42_01820 [Herpetosiphon sp.]
MAVVLVVEDEDVLLEMLAAVVEDAGHSVLVATNGQEALLLLDQQLEPPDLIISDIMMPQMNGLALAEAVRANPRFKKVPLVLMSAAISPSVKSIADQFVAKPFNIDHVESLILQYVDGRPN